MRRRIFSILFCLVFAVGCAGAGGGDIPEQIATTDAVTDDVTEPNDESNDSLQQSEGQVFTDTAGRTITISEPVTRIVGLTASNVEILFELGAGDLLVGRGEFADYPPEALEVPTVQSGVETNLEQIIALEPQVVLLSQMGQSIDQMEAIENAGISVVVVDAHDIEGVYTSIALIGDVIGERDAANALISHMESTFETISANAGENEGKTIYFEVSPLEFGLWTAGSDTFMNEVAEMLGLTNIFADISGWAEVSEEQVLSRNPDYIVSVGMYFGDDVLPDEEILARNGWENVTAVSNGAVINLGNDELSRPSHRLAEGAQILSDFIDQNR
jgi:iron complex transport system substrate-binding protein